MSMRRTATILAPAIVQVVSVAEARLSRGSCQALGSCGAKKKKKAELGPELETLLNPKKFLAVLETEADDGYKVLESEGGFDPKNPFEATDVEKAMMEEVVNTHLSHGGGDINLEVEWMQRMLAMTKSGYEWGALYKVRANEGQGALDGAGNGCARFDWWNTKCALCSVKFMPDEEKCGVSATALTLGFIFQAAKHCTLESPAEGNPKHLVLSDASSIESDPSALRLHSPDHKPAETRVWQTYMKLTRKWTMYGAYGFDYAFANSKDQYDFHVVPRLLLFALNAAENSADLGAAKTALQNLATDHVLRHPKHVGNRPLSEEEKSAAKNVSKRVDALREALSTVSTEAGEKEVRNWSVQNWTSETLVKTLSRSPRCQAAFRDVMDTCILFTTGLDKATIGLLEDGRGAEALSHSQIVRFHRSVKKWIEKTKAKAVKKAQVKAVKKAVAVAP